MTAARGGWAAARAAAAAIAVFGPARASASATTSGSTPPSPNAIGITQRLNAPLPLDVMFRDEAGNPVSLGESFRRRPVILTFAYFRCPMLCGYVQEGLLKALRALTLDAGRDFEVVVVSLDPADTSAAAAAKKAEHMRRTGRAARVPTTVKGGGGWHFLTGNDDAIQRLTSAAGFSYVRDAPSGQIAHAAGIAVVTPDGRVSRYLLGVEFSARDLRLALVEAAAGKVGGLVDRVVLACYRYDPATGRYTIAALGILRVAGAATVLGLAVLVVALNRRAARGR